MNLVLYHAWQSSASRKVRLCLAEKGLAYEGRVLDLLRFQHHSDWYKALNPGGIVPCLLVDGRPLVESNLINEFLDSTTLTSSTASSRNRIRPQQLSRSPHSSSSRRRRLRKGKGLPAWIHH